MRTQGRKVSCRFHDLLHTFISRLAESQASDSTVMALAGHVSRAMMERYSHIRMEAKRRAVDDLSGTDFAPGVAQNWAQFFVNQKSDESNSLKTSGEPGRTRTSNPLIKSELLCYAMSFSFCTLRGLRVAFCTNFAPTPSSTARMAAETSSVLTML
jgi:Phage integrase family